MLPICSTVFSPPCEKWRIHAWSPPPPKALGAHSMPEPPAAGWITLLNTARFATVRKRPTRRSPLPATSTPPVAFRRMLSSPSLVMPMSRRMFSPPSDSSRIHAASPPPPKGSVGKMMPWFPGPAEGRRKLSLTVTLPPKLELPLVTRR